MFCAVLEKILRKVVYILILNSFISLQDKITVRNAETYPELYNLKAFLPGLFVFKLKFKKMPSGKFTPAKMPAGSKKYIMKPA